MLFIQKILPNYEIVWKSKFITNLLIEAIALTVFSILVFFLESTYVTEDEIDVHELETDSQINSYNNTSTRQVEIK